MKRILVPVDFSEHSKAAARLAVAIARRHRCAVSFLHALGMQYHDTIDPELWDSFLTNRRRQVLGDLQALAEPFGEPIETILRIGPAATEIVSYAEEWRSELIVMGSHGTDEALQHYLSGSVAESVVRRAPCPVMTTRADQVPESSRGSFRKPMVAVDYSKFSAPAVRLARTLCDTESVIQLIHIFHWPEKTAGAELQEALAAAQAAELERLGEFSTRLDLAPVQVLVKTDFGRVADQLLAYIKRSETDLVIVGAHGGAKREARLGTIALRLLRAAGVPVVQVPETARVAGGAAL